eukprot:9163219-Alexandrium_andersonii.AAC.1
MLRPDKYFVGQRQHLLLGATQRYSARHEEASTPHEYQDGQMDTPALLARDFDSVLNSAACPQTHSTD